MKKKFVVISAFTLLLLGAKAQNSSVVNYLNYRSPYAPITSCFSEKGEWKVSVIHQFYTPDVRWTKDQYESWDRVWAILDSYYFNLGSRNDSRIALSHALTNNLSLSASYLHSARYNIFMPADITFDGSTKAFDLGVAYHQSIIPALQWEAGTSIMLGWGAYEFQEIAPFETFPIKYLFTQIGYQTFNQNFLLGLSYQYKWLKTSLQLNTGYIRHHHIDYQPTIPQPHPYVLEHIGNHFYDLQTDYYLDPALIFNFNFPRFEWQFHLGYPYSFGERKLSRHTGTMGIGVSYKIFKGINE